MKSPNAQICVRQFNKYDLVSREQNKFFLTNWLIRPNGSNGTNLALDR